MNQLRALRGLERDLGAEVFLVGGVVRDLVRRKEPNDVDVVVRNVAPADFEAYLRRRGTLRLVGKTFGVYLYQPRRLPGITFEIAFPRTEISTGPGHREFKALCDPGITIQEDSNRRDFTINAMYLPLSRITDDWKFSRKDIIDFHDGLGHIRRRHVVAVGDPNARIREDPVRMLRATVLLARTGYRLEGHTFAAIKRHAKLIVSEPGERIGDELVKIMESNKPSQAFKAMRRTGLLQVVFPELAACVKCKQNPKYHSYGVFEHSIYAADGACKATSNLEVRFAAICHDLGKATTRRVRPGGAGSNDVSFHNHEISSAQLTYKLLRRLKYSTKFVKTVVHLVRQHQYKYDREWTDKAVRRFIRGVGITREDLGDLDNYPLFLLRQADRMGNKMKAHLPITQKQGDFQRRILEVYEKSSAHSLGDLCVNGDDLKQEFGLGPGPIIGKIMEALFDAVESDPQANNRRTLFRLAEKVLGDGGSNTTAAKGETSEMM
jgi:tRNA nucleotidyltransferase (CCA-adding enzyme)